MTRIRAIPTVYGGRRMRSRLEARVGAALDSHQVIWTYESEGYQVDGVWYLPDFWLPDLRLFVEVKGVLDDSVKKPKALAAALPEHIKIILVDSNLNAWLLLRDGREGTRVTLDRALEARRRAVTQSRIKGVH